MKDIKILGSTVDKKFRHIESILTRMHRRLHKTVVVAVPPIPLFFFAENANDYGEVFQWLFPAAGTITRACLYIRDFDDKNGVKFYAKMEGQLGGQSTIFETRKHATIENINLPVVVGDRLIFSTDLPIRVHGIWVAFLYQIGLRDVGQESRLIEEFSTIVEAELGTDTEPPPEIIELPPEP